MSQMYGKRRVVLKSQPNLVVICGSNPWIDSNGKRHGGGGYHPLGFWHKDNGLFYADLQKPEAFYGQKWDFNERLGGVPTKKELRQFVMAYYNNTQRSQSSI